MAAEPSSAQHKRTSSDTYDAPDRKRSNKKDERTGSDAEEALTSEEIQGTEATAPATKPRNAFSELMTPKPRANPRGPTTRTPSSSSSSSSSTFTGRDGLGAYLADDAPAGRSAAVVFRTPHAVAVRDLFPKATVHCLLLPRAPARNRMHPFDALDDPALLAAVRADADRLRRLVAAELRRLLGRHSRLDAARNAALDGGGDGGDRGGDGGVLPVGRDWEAEVKVGVHAVPSMNHLHVHVLSRDMHSDRMKHRKHYNSFTTAFFVPLEDFPLAADDPRRSQKGWPERPMVCWRCGRDFGRSFKELKAHLEDEFDEWKRE